MARPVALPVPILCRDVQASLNGLSHNAPTQGLHQGPDHFPPLLKTRIRYRASPLGLT
jgi:hypothetical protein